MRRGLAVLLLALVTSTSACAGGWGTVSRRHAPEPGASPSRVRVVMRGADPITLDHALVYPDSVVETEVRDGSAVRVRSIPASEFYRVEQWESGVARSAGAVALVAAGSVWVVYTLMVGWMASET